MFLWAMVFFFSGVQPSSAVSIFSFNEDTEGWINHATEPFSVTFADGEGFGGGGALRIFGTSRNSYQIVTPWQSDWPSESYFFERITFDIRFVTPNTSIVPSVTGFKIKDNDGNESTAYLARSIMFIGDDWLRVNLIPTDTTNLPMSHNGTGLNLHIGTDRSDSVEVFVDNIQHNSSVVPEPSTIFLFGSGLIALTGFTLKKHRRTIVSRRSTGRTRKPCDG